MMTLQCGQKKKVTLLQYPKTVCIPCSGFAFLLSLCCMHWSKYRHPDLPFRSYNVKLFTFQLVVFLLLSLVYIECAGYLYTNCDVNWETCMFTSW